MRDSFPVASWLTQKVENLLSTDGVCRSLISYCGCEQQFPDDTSSSLSGMLDQAEEYPSDFEFPAGEIAQPVWRLRLDHFLFSVRGLIAMVFGVFSTDWQRGHELLASRRRRPQCTDDNFTALVKPNMPSGLNPSNASAGWSIHVKNSTGRFVWIARDSAQLFDGKAFTFPRYFCSGPFAGYLCASSVRPCFLICPTALIACQLGPYASTLKTRPTLRKLGLNIANTLHMIEFSITVICLS